MHHNNEKLIKFILLSRR